MSFLGPWCLYGTSFFELYKPKNTPAMHGRWFHHFHPRACAAVRGVVSAPRGATGTFQDTQSTGRCTTYTTAANVMAVAWRHDHSSS